MTDYYDEDGKLIITTDLKKHPWFQKVLQESRDYLQSLPVAARPSWYNKYFPEEK